MKRKLRKKECPRQQALLLTLETFLAITDMPASHRQVGVGRRVSNVTDNAPPPLQQRSQKVRAAAHQLR